MIGNLLSGLIKRFILVIFLLSFSNIVLLSHLSPFGPFLNSFLVVLSIFIFIFVNFFPCTEKLTTSVRLNIMKGGYELVVLTAIVYALEMPSYIMIFIFMSLANNWLVLLLNAIVFHIIVAILLLNGVLRMVFSSVQLTMIVRICLLLFWWVPVVNLVIMWKICRTIRLEYLFERYKEELNITRAENEVCKTKYPILLVHGIFFRDWLFINYWGRIPNELTRNGATVFYGRQQSAADITKSGQELKEQILKIIAQTGCEKVNIIAHSKGGLDARYAVSCLFMDKHVASLTTICTPHHGCNFVDRVLKKLPENFVLAVSKRYNTIYKKLGDYNPDFYGGVRDLTAERCRIFNQQVKNRDGVLYQSVGSQVRGFIGSGFPKNIGYLMIKGKDGPNDGLVSVESSKWGNYLGTIKPQGLKGISHSDMIDMMRKNIKGFDVCEFYVDIVKDLKKRGL